MQVIFYFKSIQNNIFYNQQQVTMCKKRSGQKPTKGKQLLKSASIINEAPISQNNKEQSKIQDCLVQTRHDDGRDIIEPKETNNQYWIGTGGKVNHTSEPNDNLEEIWFEDLQLNELRPLQGTQRSAFINNSLYQQRQNEYYNYPNQQQYYNKKQIFNGQLRAAEMMEESPLQRQDWSLIGPFDYCNGLTQSDILFTEGDANPQTQKNLNLEKTAEVGAIIDIEENVEANKNQNIKKLKIPKNVDKQTIGKNNKLKSGYKVLQRSELSNSRNLEMSDQMSQQNVVVPTNNEYIFHEVGVYLAVWRIFFNKETRLLEDLHLKYLQTSYQHLRKQFQSQKKTMPSSIMRMKIVVGSFGFIWNDISKQFLLFKLTPEKQIFRIPIDQIYFRKEILCQNKSKSPSVQEQSDEQFQNPIKSKEKEQRIEEEDCSSVINYMSRGNGERQYWEDPYYDGQKPHKSWTYIR